MVRWHDNAQTIKELVFRISEYLLEVNGLRKESTGVERAPEEYQEYGINYTMDSIGIFLRCPEDIRLCEFHIKPLYDKLCKRGLFPPEYPVSIGGEFIVSLPFGEDRWVIYVVAAILPYLGEYLIDEWMEYHKKQSTYRDIMEFKESIRKRWLKGDYEGNIIRKEDLEILKDPAPDLYRELRHGIEAVERTNSEIGDKLVNLWAWQIMKSISMICMLDATNMSIEEVMERIPKMVEAAAIAQRKLIEVYEEELERKM
ncbi:MAG: hypothetical protein DRJ49_06265, partial [Thermoprotei archaeon]